MVSRRLLYVDGCLIPEAVRGIISSVPCEVEEPGLAESYVLPKPGTVALLSAVETALAAGVDG